MKAEVHEQRQILALWQTNILDLSNADLYEFYVDRGDVENRIKELKDDLLSGERAAIHFWPISFGWSCTRQRSCLCRL